MLAGTGGGVTPCARAAFGRAIVKARPRRLTKFFISNSFLRVKCDAARTVLAQIETVQGRTLVRSLDVARHENSARDLLCPLTDGATGLGIFRPASFLKLRSWRSHVLK